MIILADSSLYANAPIARAPRRPISICEVYGNHPARRTVRYLIECVPHVIRAEDAEWPVMGDDVIVTSRVSHMSRRGAYLVIAMSMMLESGVSFDISALKRQRFGF